MKDNLKKVRDLILSVGLMVDKALITVVRKSSFLANLYYTIWSGAFRNEHKSVLSGRLRYYQKADCYDRDSVLLRRNIHRLEKGLIMRPRRKVFATSYIKETVRIYGIAVGNIENRENYSDALKWAHDVLAEYFLIVDETNPIIYSAKVVFKQLPPLHSDGLSKPYVRKPLDGVRVDFDDLLALSLKRRSVRWYDQKPVPRDILDKAIQIAGLSPSACNRQPFRFLIYDEPVLVDRIAEIPMGTKGFSHNFPGIIVVVGDLSAYFSERDRHVIYIDASLAAMSFLYALEVQNVSSCIINWPDLPKKERQIRRELRLRDYERIIMLISYGYPDESGMVPFSQKKDLDTLRTYNK